MAISLANAQGFQMCVEYEIVKHFISNTGEGSGRISFCPCPAVFCQKKLTRWKRDFRAVNSNYLYAPGPSKSFLIFVSVRGTQEVQYSFKAFQENRMVNTSPGFAEGLLCKLMNISMLKRRTCCLMHSLKEAIQCRCNGVFHVT